jgi:FKBP-type peptidyl-prolyl cis-trans isomerase FkpA
MMLVTLPTIFRASMACAAVAGCTALAGCSNSPTSPTAPTTLTTIDLVVGTGDAAVSGDSLTTDFTGWLYDSTKPDFKGLQFQTSIGSTPLTFTLGAAQVIKGFEEGVTGMKVGGVRRLIVPASLAYGNARNGAIPPNTPLVFEIALTSLQSGS